MVIKDYKDKNSDRILGLKRGKRAIKGDASSSTPKKIVMWIALFGLVFFINYVFFVHMIPIKKKGTTDNTAKKNTTEDTYDQWLDKGYKRYHEGNLIQAMEAFNKAIILNPKEPKAYFGRGIVLSNMDMYDKAIKDYTKVIALNPDHAGAYNKRGWVYLKKSLFDRTIKDCSAALRLNPFMAAAYYTRAMAYKAKGLLSMARKDFQKGCELGNDNSCQAYGELSKVKK